MNTQFDVIVRGAGGVGQTLALLLARERLRVALVGDPPAGEHRADIRAYALNSASRTLLEGLRAWPGAAHAQPVRTMQVQGDDGGRLQFGALEQGVDALGWIVDAAELLRLGNQAIGFQPLIERFDAGQAASLQAPLTAVCEGRASATRATYGVPFALQPYLHSAVAARLRCEQGHGGAALQWFHQGEVLALLPLAADDGAQGASAGNSVALVWSVPTERAQALMALDPEAFAQTLQTACASPWGRMELRGERASWSLALGRAQRLVGTGFALLGDAAHTVHPLAGQGLNLGLADARQLVQTLTGRESWRGLGDEKLLRRYARARAAELAQMGVLTHGLHTLFAQGDVRVQSLRNWGLSGFDRSGPLKAWAVRRAMGL